MKILDLLQRIFTMKSGAAKTFTNKLQAKHMIISLKEFEKAWKELIEDLKEHDVEGLIELQGHMVEYLTKAEKTAKKVYVNASTETDRLLSISHKVAHEQGKEFLRLEKKLEKDTFQKLQKHWHAKAKDTHDYVDNLLRKEYKRLLNLINATKDRTVMESVFDLVKNEHASYFDRFLIQSNYKKGAKKMFAAEAARLKLKRTIGVLLRPNLQTADYRKSLKNIYKQIDEIYDSIKEGVDNEHHVVMREILYLFIIMKDVNKFKNLESKMMQGNEIPSKIGEEIDHDLDMLSENLKNIAKAEIFAVEREVKAA